MSDIKLIALDLDGTLLNHEGLITADTKAALKCASERGVHIVISTGRPLNGVPLDQLEGLGVDYAITTNGAAIYRISTNELLFENGMDFALAGPVLKYLLTKDIHISVYIDGEGFATPKCLADINRTDVHQSLKDYIIATRTPVEDLYGYVKASGKKIEKITLHFYPQPDGVRKHRDEVGEYLYAIPEIETVCGGFHNFEFSKLGINKGVGLRMLAEYLGISMEQTMAIGDSGNDYVILKEAGTAVAMANASKDVKSIADFITTSNEEDGVGVAIKKFIL